MRCQYADGLWSGSSQKVSTSKSKGKRSGEEIGEKSDEKVDKSYSQRENAEETWNTGNPKKIRESSFGAYRPSQVHISFEADLSQIRRDSKTK